jgi:predicted NUDIX family phosphoesterase
MQTQKQKNKVEILAPLSESILVVQVAKLFGPQNARWHGLKQNDFEHYFSLVNKHKEFHPRAAMEQDPTYKQIIPYIIFQYEDRYFVMQRAANASEKRLQNKHTLGIGGHVRQEDLQHNSIIGWAQREFAEEVSFSGQLSIEPFGIINDDSNDVGKVHLGFVLLAKGDSDKIRVKSELKSGSLKTIPEMIQLSDQMESWSQHVLNALSRSKN